MEELGAIELDKVVCTAVFNCIDQEVSADRTFYISQLHEWCYPVISWLGLLIGKRKAFKLIVEIAKQNSQISKCPHSNGAWFTLNTREETRWLE